MSWPLSQDYNEAIQDPPNSFSDAELKTGEAVTNALGIPLPRSGNFADVYEMRCPSGSRWAVKCFTREVFGLSERYSEIGKYLRLANLPFMVDFKFLEKGIRVRSQWYPILKMQWVEGFVLNEFVRDNLDKKPILQALGQIWLRMARRLRESYIAHCDLQHGNVMFVPGSSTKSLAVKLIDYDGMCVPSLAGTQSGEVGHPAYQHPERLRTGAYNQEVDRFSLLSIAAALRCLAVGGRSLWERYDNGDNLLFRQSDLQAPAQSPLFKELLAIGDAQARMLVTELYRACQGPLDAVPLLTDLVPEEKPAAPAGSRGKTPAASRTATAATAESSAFQGIESEPIARRPSRKKGGSLLPWIVGGSVAACALLGGVLFWVLHSPSQPKETSLAAQGRPARADNTASAKTGVEKNVPQPPANPPRDEPPPSSPDKNEDKPSQPEDKTPKPAATAQLLDGPLGEVRRFEGHSGDVTGVAFSPDGKRALTGGSDNTVRLWDVASGEQIHCLNGHTQMVWSVAFSPDGKRAVSAAYDNSVRVWDLEKGEMFQLFPGHANPVRRAVFTPDGKQVLSAGWDRMVRLWDVEDAQEARCYKENKSKIYWMALSPDGKHVLSTGGDHDIHCWDVASGNELEPYKGNTGDVYAIEFSRDGQFVAASGGDRIVRIWRASEPAAPLHSLKGHDGPVNAVAFTPDGRWLLSCSHDQTVRLWDVMAGCELGRFYGPEKCKMLSVAVSPDGRHFLSGGSDHKVRLWHLPPNVLVSKPDDPANEVKHFEGHTAEVNGVTFSPDDRLALSGGNDGIVRLWDTASDKEVRQLAGHEDKVQSVAFSPDGHLALSGSRDKTARVWDVATGRELFCFRGHKDWVRSVAFSPDGKHALTASGGPDNSDCTVRLWDVANGAEIRVLRGHDKPVTCAVFTPDGRRVVSASDDKTVRLWDLADGRELRKYEGHTAIVYCVAVSGDDRIAASAGFDKTIRLWDLQGEKELLRLDGHSDLVMSVAFSPDGRRVLSGSQDKTVRLWDLESGREQISFTGDQGAVGCVAFSHDGRYALSGGADKWVRLWRLPFAPFVVGWPLQINSKPAPAPEPAPIVTRLPVPNEAAQKKCTEDIREIYKSDYDTIRQADDRVTLAGKLLKRGTKRDEEPEHRFVYLREARDQAARGGDFALCLRAIDEMTKAFLVEPLPMKTAALEIAAKAARGPDVGKNLIEQALTAVDEAEAADDYEQALKLLAIAQSAAAKSGGFLPGVLSQRQTNLKRLRTGYAKITDAVKTLADKPDDTGANLIVGKFQCFDKENWGKGLPMLAKSGNATLVELARKDLANPTEAARQTDVGQAWWVFADKQSDKNVKAAAQQRARHWFRAALPSLKGTDADRIASQLEVKKGKLRFRPGLVAELFADEEFKRKVKGRLDYKVDYNWGEGSPDEKVPADHFSIRWQGWLIPPHTGRYKLIVTHDDGVRLILDGKTVIDKWGPSASDTTTAEVTLSSQPHALQVEFLEIGDKARIHLRWSLDGGFKEQTIPLEALYHETTQERLLTP